MESKPMETNDSEAVTQPHSLYARLLLRVGCGYALWEPASNPQLEVGDVGFLASGEFRTRFNIKFVPKDSESPRARKTKTDAGLLSEGRRVLSCPSALSTGRSVVIPVASSRRPDKDSSFEEGAAVVLGTSHKHVFLEYQERVNLVQDLMKDSRYTGVQEEFESFDCIPAFVCGYVKTNHWARTVYNYTRNDKWGPQLLQVKAGAAGPKPPVDECPDLCELDQKLLAQLVNKECAVKGKGQDGATGGDDYKGNGDDAVLDQCVFVHYARIKARLQEQSATRSPRSDSGELDNESEVVGSIFMETDSADMKVQYPDDQYEHNMNEEYDPVAFLLDYILKFTAQREPEVKFAAASDLDLIELCKRLPGAGDSGFPVQEDIPRVLEQTTPNILVWGDLGMLDLSKEKKEDEKKEGEGARGDPLSLFS